MVNELSSGKSNWLRILNFLDSSHVCNNIISNNQKSVLKCKHTHKKKLIDLLAGYEVNPVGFSQDPNKVILNFSSCLNRRWKEVYFVKGLGFLYHLKRLSKLTFLHNLNCYIGTL